ncbi:hypothetical protein ASG94_05605 [Nocardioides sp. Soil805]|nr:hypothetical protein ASG94_05605 [Nocardioides sp. Soil805]
MHRLPSPSRALLLLVVTSLVSVLYVAPSQATGRGPAGTSTTPAGPAAPADRVRPDLFGIHVTIDPAAATAWPPFDVGAVRVTHSWRSVERTPGVYDWAALDAKVATVRAHGAQPMVILGGTPSFHAAAGFAPAPASPPRLAAYQAFVRAAITRYGDRADYQVWNEGNIPLFFTGSPAYLAAMTRIVGRAAHDLAPTATVVAPSFVVRGSAWLRAWYREYWSQEVGRYPVGRFVDAASISAYPMETEDPEDALALTQWARHVLDKLDFEGPLWASEVNYGASGGAPTTAPITMERQVAFVVRTFVLHATSGADRVYWFRWEPHITLNTSLSDGTGAPTPAGTAYGTVEDWLLGTRPTGCTVSKGVSACGFRVDRRTRRHVYWTRSGRTRVVRAPTGSRTMTDPAGTTSRVRRGDKVRVGLTPVMVETRARRGPVSR